MSGSHTPDCGCNAKPAELATLRQQLEAEHARADMWHKTYEEAESERDALQVQLEAERARAERAEAAADEAIANLVRVAKAERAEGRQEAEARIAEIHQQLEAAGKAQSLLAGEIADLRDTQRRLITKLRAERERAERSEELHTLEHKQWVEANNYAVRQCERAVAAEGRIAKLRIGLRVTAMSYHNTSHTKAGEFPPLTLEACESPICRRVIEELEEVTNGPEINTGTATTGD